MTTTDITPLTAREKIERNSKVLRCKRYYDKGDKYAVCPDCNQNHESDDQYWHRVSFGNPTYEKVLRDLDMLPNSPTLFNAGTGMGSLSACFKFDVGDTMEDIMYVATKAALVLKWGGGVGYYVGGLRPKGAPIRTTHKEACGPVAVLKHYHSVAELVTQAGKRPGAQMGILDCEHPDVREFIHWKDVDPQRYSTFNISVALSQQFMEVATHDPNSEQYKLLREMAESAWTTGDPGCYFKDSAERWNPTPWMGRLSGTNPCGEVPLIDNEPCNLASINVGNFYDANTNGVDWRRLETVTAITTEYCDEVLDRNTFPDPAITEVALATRKLGIGVMGWADLLALMHIHYDTKEAVELGSNLMRAINGVGHDTSIELGKKKGVFPAFEGRSSWEGVLPMRFEVPRRNATVTCIAPTGSISILCGASGGIEPHFSHEWAREMADGTVLMEEIPVADRLKDEDGEWSFKPRTSHEIAWSWHVEHQSAFQEHTDLAVSKTINMPQSASKEDFFDAYVEAWRSGCKGVTIYRDRSRDKQVLTAPHANGNSTVAGNPPIIVGSGSSPYRRKLSSDRNAIIHRAQIGEEEIYIAIGMYEDGTPGELFVTASKEGSTVRGLLDAVGILTSMALQYGVPLDTLCRKMRGTNFEPSGLTDNPNLPTATSVLDYIFRFMAARFPGEASAAAVVERIGTYCPDCGGELIAAEGCVSCRNNCGWSRCG